ncbi:MAG: hypothetical protein KGM47_10920 [Acidobacteriota bacterium]|nr:hypothetical protein [Acidobacteriota bacterium]
MSADVSVFSDVELGERAKVLKFINPKRCGLGNPTKIKAFGEIPANAWVDDD